jgi:photosystem II stability/assembly factor-like uncharacterized protein
MSDRQAGTGLFAGLKMRCIGPHRGGRVVAVTGIAGDPATFYFGACAGGIWKSTDAGTYWENVSDGYLGTAAIGALAIAPSDPTVLYAGTGETSIRGNVSHGDGVYRSTDAGRSWRNVGLADTRHIGRIRVDPHDPNRLYVAALGHAWGPNPERGIYRSTDGGETWDHVLFRSERAGAVDLSMDTSNPRILYASFWEAQRSPWALSSGGPDSGLFRSTDGGDTWEELTRKPGLPLGVIGKIGVAASPARPGRVWALVEAHDGALFRSDDWGETWQRMSEHPDLRTRAWYYMHVFADPRDADTCWVLNFQCWKSTDGGATFGAIPTPHGDNHDLWIDPTDSRRMIEGNDGGACVSHNGGDSWSSIYNQPTAQMYHVVADNRFPYRVYGSQQDNSAMSLPSLSTRGAISQGEWFEPGGGESGYIALDPRDESIIYAGAIGSGDGNGRMTRFDGRTDEERNITVWPDVQFWADGVDMLKYRFQWTFPIAVSQHDPRVLYAAAQHLLRSTDEGTSWEEASPDLTRNDRSKQVASGGPITKDNTGAEAYCTIFAFAESPHRAGLLWAGTDDGRVHLSRDAGGTWAEITPTDLPEWALISVIELSPHDEATAYIAATRYRLDDTTPYLYRTNDYGQTWQQITDGIPDGEFTRVIREDPGQRGLLFAGTETGIHVSFDDGASWQRFETNLPVVPVHDLIVKENDLVVATHGRSFWILDDLSPVRALALAEIPASPVLLQGAPAVRFTVHEGWGYPGTEYVTYKNAGTLTYAYREQTLPDGTVDMRLLDAGENPPYGALLTYYLPEVPEGEVTITITDEDGTVIRTLSSKKAPQPVADPLAEVITDGSAEGIEGASGVETSGDEEKRSWLPRRAGFNRVAWDLRYEPVEKPTEDLGIGSYPAGPQVIPGRYRATLRVDGVESAVEVVVSHDPRKDARIDDLRAMRDLLLAANATLRDGLKTVRAIRDLRTQIAGWEKRVPKDEAGDGIRTATRTVKRELDAIERTLVHLKPATPLHAPSTLLMKLAALPAFGEGANAGPTAGLRFVCDDLKAKITAQNDRLVALQHGELLRLNEQIAAAGHGAIGVAAT